MISNKNVRIGILCIFSVTIGAVLLKLLAQYPTSRWIVAIVLGSSASMAALAVRFGGGLPASFLTGFSIGFVDLFQRWLTEWNPSLGGDYAFEYFLVLGWLFWEQAILLSVSSTIGFSLGAIWVHKNHPQNDARWVLKRIAIAVFLVISIWFVWEFLLGPVPLLPSPDN